MHTSFIHLPLFLALLLNVTFSYTMISSSSITEKASENQFLIPTFLLQRLNATPLLLKNAPFDFIKLPPDLHICIASFTTPHSISNLSVTCHYLNNQITFQTPGIWNIVTHGLSAISERKMPELLLKAHLCAQATTEEQKKLFYHTIKEKILACYDLKVKKPYQYVTQNKVYDSFDPFLSDNPRPLLSACYTGDKNIVIDTIRKNDDNINDLFCVSIDREKTKIIPLLCQSYATSLESTFLSCKSHSTYRKPASELDWSKFVANTAILNNKKKSFEALVTYYKKYLNIVDQNNMTYLDFIVDVHGNKNYNYTYNKDYQEYGKIIMQHGGKGKREVTNALLGKISNQYCAIL